MPPRIALCLGYLFIGWLFYRDVKLRPMRSWAWLVPGLWLGILGSRPVGYWLGELGGYANIGSTTEEGSGVNLLVQGFLILAALFILAQRTFSWGGFAVRNKALLAIYLYYALTMLWSPHSFTCVRRVVKDFGNVAVALVLLTEEDPLLAIRVVFVRCSYVLFPLSVVFIRYFPSIGRAFSKGWELMYTGVTTQKNSLGETCLVFGLVLAWDLWELHKQSNSVELKVEKRIRYLMLLMGLWLLLMCQSKTSLLCVIVAGMVLLLSRPLLKSRNPARTLVQVAVVAVALALCDGTLDISGTIIQALGRNKTLTGRTAIWEQVAKQGTNPIIGFGFMSFWESEKGQKVFDALNEQMVEAHNGYLETYIDGGLVGVGFLAMLLLCAGRRVANRMLGGAPFGALAFAFWAVALLYNGSETDYFRCSALWFTFLLMTINPGRDDYGWPRPESTAIQTAEPVASVPSPA